MKQKIFQAKYLTAAAFFLLIYFPVFHHLDWEPIHNWDEALFSMRASYMAEEGKYLPSYNYWIEDGPRHLNSKPPFTTWIQVLSIKAFGINEIALRLPTALAVLATILLLLYASRNILGDIRIGYCAGFILVTSRGYMREHVARTADQDAIVALYMLTAVIAFYHYLESGSERQRLKWLALIVLALGASVLTKYVLGLFFLPALAIYAFYKGEGPKLLKRSSTWVAAAIVMAIPIAWLLVMESRNPGFAERAFSHEMIDRYTTTIDVHAHPWYFYFKNLGTHRFMPWLYLLPVSIYVLFAKGTDRKHRDLLLLFLLCALSLLGIITFSQTKTPHYDAAAYPVLALLAGYGFWLFLKSVWGLLQFELYRPLLIAAGMILIVPYFMINPYVVTLDKTFKPKLHEANLQYGYLFRRLEHLPDIKRFKVVHPGFDGQAVFYSGLYNRKKGYDISLVRDMEQIQVGDTIMACDKQVVRTLFDTWEMQGIDTYEKCFLARVIAEKKQVLPTD